MNRITNSCMCISYIYMYLYGHLYIYSLDSSLYVGLISVFNFLLFCVYVFAGHNVGDGDSIKKIKK